MCAAGQGQFATRFNAKSSHPAVCRDQVATGSRGEFEDRQVIAMCGRQTVLRSKIHQANYSGATLALSIMSYKQNLRIVQSHQPQLARLQQNPPTRP